PALAIAGGGVGQLVLAVGAPHPQRAHRCLELLTLERGDVRGSELDAQSRHGLAVRRTHRSNAGFVDPLDTGAGVDVAARIGAGDVDEVALRVPVVRRDFGTVVVRFARAAQGVVVATGVGSGADLIHVRYSLS